MATVGLPALAHAAVTPAITLTGPAFAASGDTLILTGHLTADAPDGIQVTTQERRVADDPTVTAVRSLPYVTTSAGGAFTVSVTPPGAGHFTYTAWATVPAAGGGYTTVSASAVVTVTGPEVYLAGSQVQAYLGHPYTVTAALRSWIGPPVPGATVHVTRLVSAHAKETLPDAVTGADGAFTITGTPSLLNWIEYTFSWDGDATHPVTTGLVPVVVSRVPTTITMSAVPVKIHDPVTVSGALGFGLGEQVTTPQVLGVSRGTSSFGPWTALPGVTTAADGSFTFQDTPPATGTWYYRTTRAADQTHAAAAATLAVRVKPRDTTITVSIPAGQTIAWAKTFTVTGRVTLEVPGTPSAAQVQVWSEGSCAQSLGADNLRLAPDGTFTATLVPACLKDLVVRASYQDADHAYASASTASVPVGRAPGVVRVDLNGSVDPRTNSTEWLSPTGLQPSVFRGSGKGRMDVYAQPAGRARKLVARLTLQDGYTTGFTYYPEVTTTFTFVWFGDAGTSASTTRFVLLVRPDLRQELQVNDGVSGAYLVYSTRTDPWYQAVVTPGPKGRPLQYVIQRYVSGTWRPFTSRTLGVDKDGWLHLSLKGTHVKGTRFRIRTIWKGDRTNAPVATSWIYYRFA